ncbi:MAG: hypothetical protein AVO38_02315 [delta proteobacterium ML8_D]|jgi:hypothetical protein|nr:MAG: hypothetical protein AVO38_02315 [delta proteobacterium ML8_D]
MTDLEKLRILLPHWVAHNHEHMAEIDRWASLPEISNNVEIKKALQKAITATEKVNEELQHAMDMAGGPIENPETHGNQQRHGHIHQKYGTD